MESSNKNSFIFLYTGPPLVKSLLYKVKLSISNSCFSVFKVFNKVDKLGNGWLGKDVWGNLNNALRGIGAKWVYGKNVWILPYYKEPQTKWRFISTYHSRRRLKSVTSQIAYNCHTSTDKVRNDILPLLSYMIRNNENMYNETEAWMTKLPDRKLDHLRFMSFDKSPSDFENIENYAKYKQREIEKQIEDTKKQKETDLKNIERWLEDEKKLATWK